MFATTLRARPLLAVLVALLIVGGARRGGVALADHSNLGLVSVGGTDVGAAQFGGASSDGAYVFFNTAEKLDPSDLDGGQTDVYQRFGGVTTLVSTGGNGAFEARFKGASADGLHVFFETQESLVGVADSDGNQVDVYEHFNGVTTLVSGGANGAYDAFYRGASSDGSLVFFETSDALVPGDSDSNNPDVYQRSNGVTTLVSAGGNDTTGAEFGGNSADGSHVVFGTFEKLDAVNDTDGAKDVYDRFNGSTILVSIGGNGGFDADFEDISDDGSKILFRTDESLTPGDNAPGDDSDIYRRSNGVTTLVSDDSDVAADGDVGASYSDSTPDGSTVYFMTQESFTGSGDSDGNSEDVYQSSGGVITLVSAGGNGATTSYFAGASDDGSRVYFYTSESIAGSGDSDGFEDVYLRENGTTTLASPGGPGLADIYFGYTSATGDRLFVYTEEPLLPGEDTDSGHSDVYEYSGGVVSLISSGGNGAFDADVSGITADGSHAFITTSDKLNADDDDSNRTDVYESLIESAGFSSAGSSTAEGAGTASVDVSLQRAPAGTATVDYTVAAGTAGTGDFTPDSGTLTFQPGQTSRSIDVAILQDAIGEQAETVILTLTNPTNTDLAVTTHTLTITDDDARLGFAASTSAKAERAGAAGLPVSLSAPLATAATVRYAVTGGTAKGGKDYTLAAGTLTFAPGQTTRNVPLRVKQDFLVEPPETVVIKLSDVTGAIAGTLKHTVTIKDDEPHNQKCGGKAATMVGTGGANTLAGTAGVDVIVGRGGKDTIKGGGGKDLLCGSGGDDTITGGGANDLIEGGRGNDLLKGGGGADVVKGQGGADRLSGGPGTGDRCDGGPATDALLAVHGCETVAGVP